MKKLIFYLIVIVFLATACNENNDLEHIIPVSGISLEKTEIIVAPGLKKVLKAIIIPENATNKAVVWSSSNQEAVKIDEVTGELNVIAVTAEKVTITVKTIDGNFTETCIVNVVDIPAIGVRIDEEEEVLIIQGRQRTLKASVLSSAAANKNIIWESDNEAIATIHYTSGEVTGHAMGWAKMTATTEDGGFQASCMVRVSSTNLLNNPGFEFPEDNSTTLTQGWNNVPIAWFSSYYDDPGSVTAQQNPNRVGPLVDGAFFSTGNGMQISPILVGNWAGRIQNNNTAGTYQLVNVTPGHEYCISVDIGYRRNNLNNHSIKTHETVKILTPDGSKLHYEVPIPTNPDMQFNVIQGITGQFIVPEGINEVRFQIDQRSWPNNTGNGAPLMVFDECEFVELPKR